VLRIRVFYVVLGLFLLLSAVACVPTAATEFEEFDNNNFDDPTNINNEWFPLQPGTQFVYEGSTLEDEETVHHRLEFTVTDLMKEIDGVRTIVAWVVDYADGDLVEKEIAFYAQDNDGNVWYLGEHPEEFENGQFVAAPTWIHGIEEARAGISMTAEPQLEDPSYSQGWSPAVDFRDRGQVSEMGQETCVPVDCYEDVLVIEEFTLEEPNAFQLKYYARDVGHVRVGWKGEDAQQEELELIELVQLSPEALAEIRELALELEANAYEISEDAYGPTSPLEPLSTEDS
jgi:hypothetical protein